MHLINWLCIVSMIRLMKLHIEEEIMGFLDTFKGKKYKADLEGLQEKYDDLEKLLSPEVKET